MKKDQKINLCIYNDCKTWGGGEKWNYDLVLYLLKNRREDFNLFCVLTKDKPLHHKLKNIPLAIRFSKPSKLGFLNPFTVLALSYYLRKKHIDTIILNNSPVMKVGGLAAKLAGVPVIIYRRSTAFRVKASLINRFFFKYIITDFLTNSEQTKAVMTKEFGGSIYDKEVRVIYNGVDIQN